MPYINFMWHPKSDEWLVGPIVNDLRAIANAHNVGFYINGKEEGETEPVVVRHGVSIPSAAIDQLRALAKKSGVTIYVHPSKD
jgi:hypothetical protein